MAPTFTGQPHARGVLCWEHEGHRGIRKGKWKLVAQRGSGWELYDMDADRSEVNDLASWHPDRVGELRSLYFAWAQRCHVMEIDALQAARRARRNQRVQ